MSTHRRPARFGEIAPASPTVDRNLWHDELRRFDTRAYVEQIRAHGRAKLPDGLRGQLALLDDLLTTAAMQRSPEPSERRLAGLVRTLANAEAAQREGRLPGYTAYANIHVLELCLGVHAPLATTTAQSARLWHATDVLLEHTQVWTATSSATDTRAEGHAAPTERTDRVHKIRQFVPSKQRADPSEPPLQALPGLLRAYLDADYRLALMHLTAMPRTTVPDEYLLIRGIQICETAFWGTLLHVQNALSLIASEPKAAATALEAAAQFTELFIPVLHLVRTIPTETFAQFAAEASAAIAVDSLSYQTLEAHVYGVLPEKRQLVSEMPHARNALRYDTAAFQPLVRFVDRAELSGIIHKIESRIYAWKTYHERKLASGGYLQDEGGPESAKGPAYLARQKTPRPG